MKVIGDPETSVFPMKVRCGQIDDGSGLSYGRAVDFCGHELEVETDDIVKHPWFKYPDYKGVDYGVICPVCGMFVQIEEEKLPQQVKETARDVSVEHGRFKGYR